MVKTKWYFIVVLIVLTTIIGAHMVHSQVVAILEHEKMHVKYEIHKEIEKQKILKAIIACESSNRHVVGTLAKVGIDIGKCQINTYWHGDKAESMGLNLYDPADNMEYCLYLFKTEGVKPWKSSQACWQQELEQENIKF
jgi:hypothetical protein